MPGKVSNIFKSAVTNLIGNTIASAFTGAASQGQTEKIAAKLLNYLNESKTGIGLAANQIGINKRVCVVNVKEPLVLINPKIVSTSEETFIFPEDSKEDSTSRPSSR